MSRVHRRRVWVPELVDLTEQDLAVLRYSLVQAIDRSVLMDKQQGASVPTPLPEVITDALTRDQRRVARALVEDIVKLEKKL